MNQNQFVDTLHHILEKDIPDDMDKLNAIRDAIAERNMIRSRRTQALSRIAAAVAVTMTLMIGSVVAYALYQTVADPGLENAIEQGLVQEINESQTIDGVTVTVKEAYADTTRVAIWYTIEAEGISSNDVPLETLLSSNVMLINAAITDGELSHLGYDPIDTHTYLATFNHTLERPESGVYPIDFQLTFGGPDRFAVDIPDDAAQTSGEIPDEYKITLPEIGPFTFDLELAVNEPVTLQPDATVTSNGLDVTLKSVEIAPSQTNIELCYDLPDNRDWQPKVKLMLDEVEGIRSSYGTDEPTDSSQTNRCEQFKFLLAYTGNEQQISIFVDGLRTNTEGWTEDSLDRAEKRLAEQGIIVEFSLQEDGFIYESLEVPEDMDIYELDSALLDALSEHYEGEWQFTLDLPQ